MLGPAAIAWLLLIEILGRNSTRITRWPPSRHDATLTSTNPATTSTDATVDNPLAVAVRGVTSPGGSSQAALVPGPPSAGQLWTVGAYQRLGWPGGGAARGSVSGREAVRVDRTSGLSDGASILRERFPPGGRR